MSGRKDDHTSPKALKKSVGEAVEKVENDTNVIQINSKVTEAAEGEDHPHIVHLSNTYNFEGKEYNHIDLRGLNDLNTKDLNVIEKQFFGDGNVAPINEMSIGYTAIVAARACKLPVELFENLKANDAVKIKNAVSTFLLS